MDYLREFAELGKNKLIRDKVIDDAESNILLMPTGRALPNRMPWAISIFQIKLVPIDPFNIQFRRFRITLTVRVIYRTRTRPLDELGQVYGDMLNVADRIASSWDRNGSFRQDYADIINSTDPVVSLSGNIVFTDMDTEPVERDSEFFYLNGVDADATLPVGYSLDLFFSSPAIAIQTSCR